MKELNLKEFDQPDMLKWPFLRGYVKTKIWRMSRVWGDLKIENIDVCSEGLILIGYYIDFYFVLLSPVPLLECEHVLRDFVLFSVYPQRSEPHAHWVFGKICCKLEFLLIRVTTLRDWYYYNFYLIIKMLRPGVGKGLSQRQQDSSQVHLTLIYSAFLSLNWYGYIHNKLKHGNGRHSQQ